MTRRSRPDTSFATAVALHRVVVVAVMLTTFDTGAVLAQTAPGAPDPVRIYNKTTSRIQILWLDRSNVETGFAIYRSIRGERWLEVDQVDALEGSPAWGSYSDSTLSPDTYYCYRIDVYNEHGRSFSDPACTFTNRITSGGTVIVDDRAGLAGELRDASDGLDIYIDNDARIRVNDTLRVRAGVTLRSGRRALIDGALIFTDRRDLWPLLDVRGVNVRISGLRIQGAQRFVAETRRAVGIRVSLGSINIPRQFDNANKIEIDNNEIYGWSRDAIRVEDSDSLATNGDRITGRINGANAGAVHIHDNYIHHNQHTKSAGYGVVLGDGAYALIERNVFDHNRHAIAADGREGTGYIALKNLILRGGGKHKWLGFWPGHTHQFDMHGRNSCDPVFGLDILWPDWSASHSCGLAGEYMEIRHNTFQYKEGAAFKLRGKPQLWNTPDVEPGAVLVDNVFAHRIPGEAIQDSVGGFLIGPLVGPGESIRATNNLYGIDTVDEIGTGDFDGDGVCDEFQATGVTWWYSSGGRMGWHYLNTARERLHVLLLEDVDGDEITDVLTEREDGWFVSYGGVDPWSRIEYVPRTQSDLRPGSTRLGRTEECD